MDYDFDETLQLEFSPDVDQISIPFSIREDLIVERNEMFSLIISVPANPGSNYSVLSNADTAVITIQDDDGEGE